MEAIGVNLSAEEAVAILDTNGDGLLAFDDFVRFVERWNEEDKQNDLKEAFQMYDEMVHDYVFKVSRLIISKILIKNTC